MDRPGFEFHPMIFEGNKDKSDDAGKPLVLRL